LLWWLAARARRGGIGNLLSDRVLRCSTKGPCTSTSWRFSNWFSLRTARVRIDALYVNVFDTPVSETARSGGADLGRFFDTGSHRAARTKASNLGSGLIRGLFEGVARFSRVVLDEWSRGRRVLETTRLRTLAFDRLFGGIGLRTKRDSASIRTLFLDRPDAFTRTLSQAKMVLRLILGDGAVAAARI
jgi:hypothetical protein